jgi:hypothetical protein
VNIDAMRSRAGALVVISHCHFQIPISFKADTARDRPPLFNTDLQCNTAKLQINCSHAATP